MCTEVNDNTKRHGIQENPIKGCVHYTVYLKNDCSVLCTEIFYVQMKKPCTSVMK